MKGRIMRSPNWGSGIFAFLFLLFIATGIVVANNSQTILELSGMTETISVGNELLNGLHIVVISGLAIGLGIGIITSSLFMYRRKKAQLEDRLS